MKNTSDHSSEVQDQDLLKALLDSHPMQMALLDAKFNFVRVNIAYAEADGKDPSYFPGKNHFDLYPNEENQQIFQKVVETGQSFQIQAKPVEYEKNKERGVSWWDWSLAPVKDDGGNVTGLILSLVDVTKHKRAEESLRESEKQLSRVYDTTSDVLFYIKVEPDNCYRFQSVNQSFLNNTGLKKEQVVGKRIEEVIPANSIERVLGNYRKAIDNNEIVSWEEVSAFPTGVIIGEVSIAPVFDEKGNCTHLVGSVHDITEYKQAEQALRESEELSRAVIDHSPVGIAVRSRTGRLLSYNKTWRDIWQVSDEDLDDYQHRDRDKLTFDDRDDYLGDWRPKVRAIYEEGGYLYILELEIKSAGKKRNLWLSHHFYAIKDAKGNVDSVVTLTNDITKRKQTENMLRLAVEGTSAKTGEEFFQSLVQYLTKALGMKYALIGELIQDDKEQIQTLVICADGKIVDNMVYDLAGTPCANIAGKQACVYPSHVQASFPDDHLLVDMKAECYLGTPLVDSAGKPLGVLAVIDTKPFTDELQETARNLLSILGARATAEIERVRAERVLEERDYILRESQRVASLGSYDLNVISGVWTSSEVLNAVFGIDANFGRDLEGWLQLVHPDHRQEILTYFTKEVIGDCAPFDRQYQIIRHSDGETRWVHGLGNLVFDSEGVPIRMIGTIQDITQRKLAEVALKESEERVRSIIENTDVGYFFIDLEGVYRDVNSAFVRMHKYASASEIIGEHFTVIQKVDDVEKAKEFVVGIMAGDTNFLSGEFSRKCKDGSIGYHTFSARPVHRSGEVVGIEGFIIDTTERKRAEQAMQESRAKLLQAQYITRMGDFTWDIVSGETIWSDGLYELLKYDKSETIDFAKINDAIHHPDDLEMIGNWLNESVSSGEEILSTNEYRLICKDGKVIWVQTNGRFELHDGKAVRLFGTCQDITERKLAQEKLKNSERRSHAWLENSPVCTKVLDLDFNLQFMSAAGIEALNIDDVTKLYGKPYPLDFYPDSFRNTMNGNLEKAKETGETITQEASVVDIDGKALWFHSTIVPVNDDAGQLDYILVLSLETTERKRAEQAMQESNTRYEHLFSRMIDGFALHEIICDESGKPVDYRFLAMNPAFEKLTGLKAADLVGKRAYEELPGLEPIWAERYGAVALKGEAIQFEEYSATLDKHFEISAYRPAAGQFACIFADVTETKRLRELESRAQRLETAGQIAGQVAHDFNNLLAPLMAYPEFIRDELGSDHPALQYLDDIENASQQIADINQQLLTLGRRGHYNQEVMNLNDVVSQAVRQMEAPPSTLAIETILDKEPMNIKGGRSQIFRAISNLLVNAREAMQDIGQLTVRTENFYIDKMWINYAQVPPAEYVKLTISDTGCGIPDEIRLKIFEPFFTTKTADKKRGSGLGISVVDAVVKDHEGYVDLTSTMGEGTSFFLYFPVTREVIDVPPQNEMEGGDETVLIIDDDKVQRDVCTKLLKSLGYSTTSVESGEEAVRLLGEQSFDLLILDMIMPPGIDGAETYRQTLLTHPDQKAIIVSGFAESDRVAAALDMGAGAFVKKPLTRRRLATAVREELDRVTKPS